MRTADIRTALIKRILDAFQDEKLKEFVSGVNAPHYPGIDDGQYGDPLKSTKPDFVQKDDDGWQAL